MINELNVLEEKISHVTSLCHVLRSENSQLRQQLAAVEAEKKGLEERIGKARHRLEELAQQLPATITGL